MFVYFRCWERSPFRPQFDDYRLDIGIDFVSRVGIFTETRRPRLRLLHVFRPWEAIPNFRQIRNDDVLSAYKNHLISSTTGHLSFRSSRSTTHDLCHRSKGNREAFKATPSRPHPYRSSATAFAFLLIRILFSGYLPETDATGKEKWPRGDEKIWKAGIRGLDKGSRFSFPLTRLIFICLDESDYTKSFVNHVQTSLSRQAYNLGKSYTTLNNFFDSQLALDNLGAYQASALAVRDNLLVG